MGQQKHSTKPGGLFQMHFSFISSSIKLSSLLPAAIHLNTHFCCWWWPNYREFCPHCYRAPFCSSCTSFLFLLDESLPLETKHNSWAHLHHFMVTKFDIFSLIVRNCLFYCWRMHTFFFGVHMHFTLFCGIVIYSLYWSLFIFPSARASKVRHWRHHARFRLGS